MFPKRSPFGNLKSAQTSDANGAGAPFPQASAPAPIPNPEKQAQKDAEAQARAEDEKERKSLQKLRQAANKAVADDMNGQYNDKPDEIEFYPPIATFKQFSDDEQKTTSKNVKTEKASKKPERQRKR